MLNKETLETNNNGADKFISNNYSDNQSVITSFIFLKNFQYI